MRLDHKSIATTDSSGGNARKERCVLVEGQTTVCRIFNWLFEIVWDDRPRAIGAACERRRERPNPRQTSMPVVIGSGSHPFPFRTRKLSLIPPMVLRGKLCGRVGRCRHYFEDREFENNSRAFSCTVLRALFQVAASSFSEIGRAHV